MNITDKKVLQETLEKQIQDAIDYAKKIADENDIMFDINPAYGIGGSYYSPGFLKEDLEHHKSNGYPHYAIVNQFDYYTSLETGGWVSSSMEC
ncbi:hypothetical protein PP427_gp161 [Salmonella phage KM16]|uniref:hypothetical protein n=1 Tax=Salmonella phage KM16 TaxID=2797303 RepID=UPI0024904E30|nr:hypothetical protein PP427_gp161 [Salmonella phage KM16]